jgi:thermitase
LSPAPNDDKSNNFSNRIRKHPKLVQHWEDPSLPCIWMIDDELLFLASASPVAPQGSEPTERGGAVQRFFKEQEVEPRLVTTLFADRDQGRDIEDVHLVRLAGRAPDLGGLVERLRGDLLADDPAAVSPNHILIPAANGDGCPHGPPQQYRGPIPPPIPPAAQPQTGSSPSFTLIDSGYMWEDNWGDNPLDAVLGYRQPPAVPGGLLPTQPERPDADGDKKLDALAGHANFAAGVLAQRCNAPSITIWNHNASFVGNDAAHIPTEFAVLNTLVASQTQPPTPVIVVIFAFPVLGGKIGGHWEHTLAYLRRKNGNFVIVAPTGNQEDTARRYPAALAVDHPEVLGVGSLNDAFDRSDFSNYGTSADPWVTCSAVGEDVASTFLHVNMEPEDRPWPLGSAKKPHNFATNDWAIWQGTSFAAPKVAAAIANQLDAAGGDALAAWRRVRDSARVQLDDVGWVLDQL